MPDIHSLQWCRAHACLDTVLAQRKRERSREKESERERERVRER
jgi:hypothetical protein